MSNSIFPTLAGLQWDVAKIPEFRNKKHQAVSGRESSLKYMLYPMYAFNMSYSVLRQTTGFDELKTLMGLFLAMNGNHDSFLFTDTDDYSVTDQPFGVRTTGVTLFQLVRTFGAGGFTFAEPVQNVNVLTNIKANGVTLTNPADYTISSTGMVNLTVAGTPGHVLTWTGTYYFRVRFRESTAEFNQFMKNLWEFQRCELYGSLSNKV